MYRKAVPHSTGEAVRKSCCRQRSPRLHRSYHFNIATLHEQTELLLHRDAKETQEWGRTPHIFSKNKWTQKIQCASKKKKKLAYQYMSFFFFFFLLTHNTLSFHLKLLFTSGFAGTLAIQPWFITGCSNQQIRWKHGSKPGPHDPHVR